MATDPSIVAKHTENAVDHLEIWDSNMVTSQLQVVAITSQGSIAGRTKNEKTFTSFSMDIEENADQRCVSVK